MFKKILIANRGEIACRIIATCKRMNIETVAVYAETDNDSKHLKMADYSVSIEGNEGTNDYLSMEAILSAALEHNVEAIHPGYGFLSENPDFANLVLKNGIKFIGPSPEAISFMGMKDKAKDIALAADVPIIPGYQGNIQSDDFLYSKAEEIGFPILIKPCAGGGGKGMRLVKEDKNFLSELQEAKSESLSVFGDDNIILEKFFQQARHIEVQIFADEFGNIVHAFERECSIQRRYQKLIEEAPAAFIPDDVRQKMLDASIRLAKEINYVGAGTVEFLLVEDEPKYSKEFFFMEMNTRLQVEHPVSEAITGLDFVELQLRISYGDELGITQETIFCNGHSIESRIYAEDPQNDFMPSTGKIYNFIEPPDTTHFSHGMLRLDHAVDQGTVVSPFYDPMIAKLIVHGSDRNDAIRKCINALTKIRISGIVSNTIFLSKIMSSESFSTGKVDTSFLSKNISSLTKKDTITDAIFGAIIIKFFEAVGSNDNDPWSSLKGWTNFNSLERLVEVIINDQDFELRFSFDGLNNLKCEVDGKVIPFSFKREPGSAEIITNNSRDRYFYNQLSVNSFQIFNQTEVFKVVTKVMNSAVDPLNVENSLRAKLPAVVKKLLVSVGDHVQEGDLLLILEAMKMEQRVLSTRNASIKSINVSEGSQVTEDQILLELE